MKKASKKEVIINKDEPSNEELLEIEAKNWDELGANPNDYQYLYPNLDDPNFNIKIKNKKEFSDTKYDGTIVPIAQRANELSNAEYELLPQQAFVKNFMSFHTPYNSLLLFHGLGSGKTCSAIGVCEEMRDYLKQMGISKRIIIVASPNVQDNFKLQLFDERKLKLVDGLWTIKGCLGNKLLKEINPTGMKGLSRDKVVQQVKNIISSSYYFVGYLQFSNDIAKHWKEGDSEAVKIRNLQNEYSDRLIVIDEVHNIRIANDNNNKSVAQNLMYLVSVVDNLRLLLLSATPMFNSYKEIVWLLNLMNKNDGRGIINISDIFDVKTGNITEEGREMLIRKANGYISYVRGENPYTFPFRVYPDLFAPSKTFNTAANIPYPGYQLNGKPINKKKIIKKLSLFLTKIGSVQEMGYNYIIDKLRKRSSTKSFGYTDLQLPIEALNIVYPHPDLEELSLRLAKLEPDVNAKSEDDDDYEDLNERDDINIREDAEASPTPSVSPSVSPRKHDVVSEKQEESLAPKLSDVEKEEMSDEYERVMEKGPEHVDEPVAVAIATTAKAEEGVSVKPIVKEKEKEKEKEDSDEGTHIIELDKTISNAPTVKNDLPSVKNDLPSVKNDLPSSVSSSTSSSVGGGRKKKVQVEADTRAAADSSAADVRADSRAASAVLNINPKELTGADGLKRIMNYNDSITPLNKGDFEYKPQYAKDPIFSPANIEQYSAKIKTICDYIYGNTANDGAGEKTVSDGIILIYSSYIDAGLIPMALALEEMGFTRYNGKSLFKKAPTPAVDVRTMQPPTSKSNFCPAKYVMITGDRRLSPNNDTDVKNVTNGDNMEKIMDPKEDEGKDTSGREVKVVLLSQAGSEGIDFKSIRQIHILDPWYNVSRLEQIIGRGVRNFSHKDLEFKYRNVQIFLYGTLLTEKEEEAVDLYVYRISELKAVKIGNVTRLLKQVSVDCHINHDQTQLTTAKFEEILGKDAEVDQVLSNHEDIPDFLVGDVDNTATCDYQSCKMDCLPDAEDPKHKIQDNEFNLNTYNETFMLVNSDKIIQKIRALFSDRQDGRFFFKKKTLMKLIKRDRNYPTVQIYAALTQMITDNSEYITDKYGRTGHLINIGEYYFFQPSELNYPNISVFERSRPLDYKHDMINFDIKTDIVKQVIDKRNIDLAVLEKEGDKMSGLGVLNKMFGNYITAVLISSKKSNKLIKVDNLWYENCGVIIKKMKTDEQIMPGITDKEREERLYTFLAQHIVDELMLQERVDLMNYLEENTEINSNIPEDVLTSALKLSEQLTPTSKNIVKNTADLNQLFIIFMTEVSKYLLNKRIQSSKGRLTGVIIFNGPSSLLNDGDDNGNMNVYILKEKVWQLAEPEDIRDLDSGIKKKYKLTKSDILNKFVGFIGFESNRKFMTLKIKNTSDKDELNTAYRCDQSGKDNIIDTMIYIENEKIEEPRYFKKVKKDAKMTEKEYNEINKHKTKDGAYELCIREEFTLRSFQKEEEERKGKNKVLWFLETERAIYNEFEKREKLSK